MKTITNFLETYLNNYYSDDRVAEFNDLDLKHEKGEMYSDDEYDTLQYLKSKLYEEAIENYLKTLENDNGNTYTEEEMLDILDIEIFDGVNIITKKAYIEICDGNDSIDIIRRGFMAYLGMDVKEDFN